MTSPRSNGFRSITAAFVLGVAALLPLTAAAPAAHADEILEGYTYHGAYPYSRYDQAQCLMAGMHGVQEKQWSDFRCVFYQPTSTEYLYVKLIPSARTAAM
ncbi:MULTISPECIES: hypothetical protein [Actinomadura]|uniref:Secreted protein n=1 Tax=Actinomadura yumaensis TaxID=111807 RepID=A0ABW2CJA8_9ACTN|nr:hypothetical protein [Actinomadura sp. J1-007]MWK37874.1 hypothetical protein [Actinomadura sp. J1-007]